MREPAGNSSPYRRGVISLRRFSLRRDDGSVAVEAAFIFPVLIMILFGIIEFSLMLRDHVALTSAARSGTRTASAEPRTMNFDQDAADAVIRAGIGMPNSTIEEVWIYEATDAGYPYGTAPNAEDPWASCSTRCVKYTVSRATGTWAATKLSGTWDYTDVNACQGEVMTNIGVYIRALHRFVTGISPTSITEHAVMRFEPIPANQLAAGATCK